jgi:hypothetical protein
VKEKRHPLALGDGLQEETNPLTKKRIPNMYTDEAVQQLIAALRDGVGAAEYSTEEAAK